jgi:hypothetical protein
MRLFDRRCGHCRFAVIHDAANGHCRRFPPTPSRTLMERPSRREPEKFVVRHDEAEGFESSYPLVSPATGWCGEYRRAWRRWWRRAPA